MENCGGDGRKSQTAESEIQSIFRYLQLIFSCSTVESLHRSFIIFTVFIHLMDEPRSGSPSEVSPDTKLDERSVFYLFDAGEHACKMISTFPSLSSVDADGRLTSDEFKEALRVCGVQLT